MDIDLLKEISNSLNKVIEDLSKKKDELMKELTPKELEEFKRKEKRMIKDAEKGDFIALNKYRK